MAAEKNELLADARRQALAVIRESKDEGRRHLGAAALHQERSGSHQHEKKLKGEAELIQDLLADERPTYEDDELSEPVDVAVGDKVFVRSIRQEGTVLGPPEEGSVLVKWAA